MFSFLVSEDSHSLMGGSDVVNCGRYWAFWAHRIAIRISNMLLSVWGLFVGEQTNCVDDIAVASYISLCMGLLGRIVAPHKSCECPYIM